jgi:hypothetical protein
MSDAFIAAPERGEFGPEDTPPDHGFTTERQRRPPMLGERVAARLWFDDRDRVS